ncbi:iron complex outermembrane recepter protein [Pseudoalteromonas ulvae UL12]|uniref:TonB-dependent siderophore receptor n=1 Tax=Pseudoalteromonas ulvae TaxID=107327 RepID=UPI00186B9614|nr:TonB-dependent siderophore receptor [Pseudoalteromonas ulvae]MBE0365497.1 iron complex outermembrane recepter protein [Pseudoalteromonas ulvae UL12]
MHVSLRSFQLCTIHLAVALSLCSTGSYAQNDPSIETIEVTAKRQAYRGNFDALKTPEAVSEINQQLIANTGVTGLTQALDLSASVSRQNSLGGLWDSFAIRGFFGDENVPSGYLVNGFNAGRGFSGPRDLSGIERVEVLKGPKAALYGRGEPGGTINLITKQPTFEQQGSIALELGSRDKRRFEADFSGGLTEQTAARVIGFYETGDSFRDTIDINKKGVMASVLFEQSTRSVWQYELEAARQEIPFDRGILALGGDFDMMPIERFLGEPGDGPTTTEVLGHQLQWQYELSNDWAVNSGLSYRSTQLTGTSSDAEVSPSRQKLYYNGRTLTRQRRQRDYDTDQFVIRSELAGKFDTGTIAHELIVGIDYDLFDYDRDYRVYRAPALSTNPSNEMLHAIDIYQPVYGQHALPTPVPAIVRVQKQIATGLYLQDQMHLTDNLHVRVGGRIDRLKQTLDDQIRNVSAEQSESHFSPQAGVVYQLSDSWSLYSSYGEGYRLNFGTDATGQGFKPNETTSGEIGTKFNLLDNNLGVTVAYFDSTQKNIIVADAANPGFHTAIGQASSTGVELDITGQLPGGLDLWFSYAYIEAQVDKDARDTGLGVALKKGDELLNIPQNSASVQISKQLPVFERPLTVGVGANYVDERLGQRGSDFYLPAYTVANMFAKYDVTQQFEVKLQVHNLFDRTYFPNSYTQIWVQPGEPRSVDITLSYTF